MYMALENITDSGMDAIANTLSTNTSFATAELADMYYKTQQDIARSLAEVDANLKENIAEAKADFEAALTEAAKIRNEKLAQADAALLEALAEAKLAFDEALADAQKQLTKAQEEAKKTLDKGLLEAQKALDKALLDAQQAFEKAIDAINKSMQKKLDDLIEKIRAAQAAIAALGGASPTAPMPSYTPFSSTPIITNANPYGGQDRDTGITNNISVTSVTNADSKTIANDIVYAIKYGQVVEVAPNYVGRPGEMLIK
jgi:tetratricopeptide (TPR) repeat protein